jgi:hypothetical protein
MRTRKKAVVGRQKPELGEQTAVPVGGDLARAQMGAAMYLAVLAYPAHSEWPKRDQFIEAVKAGLLKEARRRGYPGKQIQKRYREFREKRINQILDRAYRRILRWRMPAGMAANWMLMDGARFGPAVLPGNIPVRAIILHAPNSPRRAMQEIRKKVEQRDGAHREEDSALANLHHRVWANSLPVLHLVMPIAQRLNSEDDPTKLIYDPSWVGGALRYAELLVEYLPHKIPSFNPRRMSMFLAASCSTRSRFIKV